MRFKLRRSSLAAALALIAFCATPAFADDPAIPQVDALDHALLEAMKGGAALGVKGRFHKLEPVVERVFDLPAMTRFAVGPTWSQLTDAQQKSLIDAFTRLTVASYAHNFASFDGERFQIDPNVQSRGLDKVVQTQLVPPGKAPVNLIYRMRQSADGTWKAIDVYYGAISQLTMRRSDFQAPLASGGAAGLIAHLNELTDKALK
ncbi:MAG TPA: ABC transporter substrate-binding protein [Caulobacteraceae bacterium]|nr:ABC transporter substrate-binding protein [Caulobacteraceae bacterium]